MNTPRRGALAIVLIAAGAALAGCADETGRAPPAEPVSADRHAPGDGAIDLDGDRVIIEAGGQTRRAIIDPDGTLTLGDDVVVVDQAGRSALVAYSGAAVALKTHAIALGRTGAEFGVDVLRDVVRGLFDGDMASVGARARDGARDLVGNVRDLCQRLDAVHAAQTAAAAAVPAFAPYAVLDVEQVRDCHAEIDDEARPDDDDSAPAT